VKEERTSKKDLNRVLGRNKKNKNRKNSFTRKAQLEPYNRKSLKILDEPELEI